MTKARLARLEKAARAIADRPCILCYGEPFAAVIDEWERDPHGPGLRRTGRRWLTADEARRVTVDLRCAACGAAAGDHVVLVQRITGCGRGPEDGDVMLPVTRVPRP
jgi:hypothetical protein